LMKQFLSSVLLCLVASGSVAAQGQAARDAADAQKLYAQANMGASSQPLRIAIAQQLDGFLGDGTFQAGALRTFDGQRRPVPGLRYHLGQHVLEAKDSLNEKLTHLWPVGSLYGFDIGEEETAPRRFRPRLVRGGKASGTQREFVEILTTLDAGPLVLALVHSVAAAGSTPQPLLVAGPGYAGSEALRPLELTQVAVLHLFGKRSEEIRSFAAGEHLHYDQATDVAKMLDYFNRVAVAQW
jgi:hypothetical protein